tara:strand:- start:1031 stop:1315 length:285 start_codon:yes stop_codon:yes gene_type:complete
MRKILLSILIATGFIFSVYFFSDWGEAFRDNIWTVLDQDVIYRNEEPSLYGQIWNETDEAITGSMSDGTLFKIDKKECKEIKYNVLLDIIKKLI